MASIRGRRAIFGLIGAVRFAILASGSNGNATVVASDTTSILIDCGVSLKVLQQRAAAVDFDLASLSAVLVTHEHGDHASGVAALARRLSVPVFLTHGTATATNMMVERGVEVREISPHVPFTLGDLEVDPAPVPHDAREPCQFVVAHKERRLGVLTDIGSVTPFVEQHYLGCHGLVLEFNHDRELLAGCAYPESLKARVGGRFGHFSNAQAGELLGKLKSPDLQTVVAAHLSENSNTPEHVGEALCAALDGNSTAWKIAERDESMPWITLS